MKKATSFQPYPRKQRARISDLSMANDDFRKLYRIFRLTICPGMSEKGFEAYYHAPGIEYIDATFFHTASGELYGFSAAAFYHRVVGGRQVVIARSATGILPQYRGGSLSKMTLYGKYMRYKLKHPFRHLALTIFASNPFIYSMVCKYTGIVYPRHNQPVPARVAALKNSILEGSKLQRRERQPFVVRINFEVEKSEALRQQATQSTNPHVQYFVQQTGLQQCMSLLLIIPVSFRNILLCLWLMLRHHTAEKKKATIKHFQRKTKIYKNRLTCWLNQSTPAGYASNKPL